MVFRVSDIRIDLNLRICDLNFELDFRVSDLRLNLDLKACDLRLNLTSNLMQDLDEGNDLRLDLDKVLKI